MQNLSEEKVGHSTPLRAPSLDDVLDDRERHLIDAWRRDQEVVDDEEIGETSP